MTEDEKLFLNMFITAPILSHRLGLVLSNDIIESYLEIKSLKTQIYNQIRKEYLDISKERFYEKCDMKSLLIDIDKMKLSLLEIIDKWTFSETNEILPNEEFIENNSSIWNYYYYWIKQDLNKTFILNIYPQNKLYELSDYLIEIGYKIIRLKICREIGNFLEFNKYYSTSDKKIVKKPSEAFWELYQKNDEIDKEEMLKRVLDEYIIEIYQNLDKKNRENRIKIALNSWYYYISKKTKND